MIVYKSPISSTEFANYFSFRWEKLRKSLNLPRGSEQDEIETSAFHIAAYSEDKIIACGRLQIESDQTARIRYMAVDEKFQRQGVGSSILRMLEQVAHTKNIRACWLFARQEAINFYINNGYVIKGEGKSELSEINHVRMEKPLV